MFVHGAGRPNGPSIGVFAKQLAQGESGFTASRIEKPASVSFENAPSQGCNRFRRRRRRRRCPVEVPESAHQVVIGRSRTSDVARAAVQRSDEFVVPLQCGFDTELCLACEMAPAECIDDAIQRLVGDGDRGRIDSAIAE